MAESQKNPPSVAPMATAFEKAADCLCGCNGAFRESGVTIIETDELQQLRAEAQAFRLLLRPGCEHEEEPNATGGDPQGLGRKILFALFQRLDANNSGWLTKEEVVTGAAENTVFRAIAGRVLGRSFQEGDALRIYDLFEHNDQGGVNFCQFIGVLEERVEVQGSCVAGLNLTTDRGAAANRVHHGWGYHGVLGPSKWHLVSPAATTGREQSPVNISAPASPLMSPRAHAPLPGEEGNVDELEYLEDLFTPLQYALPEASTVPATLVDSGHTLRVDYVADALPTGAGTLTLGSKLFYARQFHFHAAAEHLVDGIRYPLELHVVHVSPVDNQLAVLGVLYKIGDECPFLSQFVDAVPSVRRGRQEFANISLDSLKLLGGRPVTQYVRLIAGYRGSLTTPPCTENVLWNVVRRVHTCSEAQLNILRTHMPRDNFRPEQPLNGRRLGGFFPASDSDSGTSTVTGPTEPT